MIPDAVICDLDGVLYRGTTAIAGAGDALRRLRDGGIDIHFVTNNSTKTAAEAAAKIARLTGFEAVASDVVTSAQAAARLIADDKPRTYLFGAAGAREPLAAAGVPVVDDWTDAEVVVAGLDPGLTYERLTAAVMAVRSGARFVATNVDATYPTRYGLWPGAGALIAAIVAATGVQPEVAGKPEMPIRRLLEERTAGRRVAVIGDRPETDLALGIAEGWPTILVLSGVTESPEGVDPPPDYAVDSITEVPGLLGLPPSRSGAG